MPPTDVSAMPPTDLPTQPSRSRRAVLTTALAGSTAAILGALGRPSEARAGTDGDVVLGAANPATATTSISFFSGSPALHVDGVNIAVEAYGDIAINAIASKIGVNAIADGAVAPTIVGWGRGNAAGVLGWSTNGSESSPPTPTKTGVVGIAMQDASSRGVVGRSAAGQGVRGEATTGNGVYGTSSDGVGVYGESLAGPGILGVSPAGAGAGVQGFSGAGSPPAGLAKVGVHGYADADATARGVVGQTTAGRGVDGVATTGYGVVGAASSGIGVRGTANDGLAAYFTTVNPAGFALRTLGRIRFDKAAGLATIAAGSKSVTVTPGTIVTTATAIVATLQGSAGGTTTVHRVAIDTVNNRFTIYLTANSTVSVKVAWHAFG
jgi:hypothetical protein